MELVFKGKRNYLTGADIINYYSSKLLKKKNIIFNFYKLTSNKLKIKKIKKNEQIYKKKNNLVCIFICNYSNEKYLVTETNRKISKRVEYIE